MNADLAVEKIGVPLQFDRVRWQAFADAALLARIQAKRD